MANAVVVTEKAKTKGLKPQAVWIGNGNEAVAQAIIQIGYDGEGYYPITPSSDAGEAVSKAFAAGETDIAFVPLTSELAAISACAGMAIAGGRVVDVTSANGLLLKIEEMPAISGLALPMVLNLSTRDVSAPLNIKNGHSDLAACLGMGWTILCAPTVQATYDLNIIALKLAEAVNLPAIVAYDGFHTSHANRRIEIFAEKEDVRKFLGEKPKGTTIFDVENPHTFGPYMNDDLINTKVQIDAKMARAYEVLPEIFEQYAKWSGRSYGFVERYGADDAEVVMVMINTGGETAKDAVDRLLGRGEKVAVVIPKVLRPFPEKELVEAVAGARTILVGERVSQYGASNYLAWRLEEARWVSATHGWAAFCCIQQRHSYLRPKAGASFDPQIASNDDLLDYCRAQGMTLLAYSPLLWGAYTRADREFPDQYLGADSDARLAALRSVASELGATLNQVVYAWMIRSDPPVIPLVAASTLEQVEENLGTLGVQLSSEQVERLTAAGA